MLGAIAAKYASFGGPGRLGFPVGEEGQDTRRPGTWYSNFQRGDVIWSASTGAHAVVGELLRAWQARGAAAGWLGLPTGDDSWVAGGSVTTFQGGTVYWSQATGARALGRPVLTAYESMGGPASSLGFPVSDTYASGGRQRADFQRGQLAG